jgi:hypothetical protein
MSRTRINDRLSEFDERVVAAAEADLDRLLALDPSPDFAARVLARISEARADRRWRASWFAVALASTAAVIAVGTAITLRQHMPVVDVRMVSLPVRPDTILPAGPLVIAPMVAARHVAPAPSPAEPRAAEPEVLVSDERRLAIARLLASASAGTLDPRLFSKTASAPEEDVRTDVAPLIVEELLIPIMPIGHLDDDVERR